MSYHAAAEAAIDEAVEKAYPIYMKMEWTWVGAGGRVPTKEEIRETLEDLVQRLYDRERTKALKTGRFVVRQHPASFGRTVEIDLQLSASKLEDRSGR